MNIPIAIAAFLGATAVLKESKNEARGTHYDVPGAILVTAGLGLLVWGFTRAANPDLGWSAGKTLLSLGAAVVLLAGFVWRETMSPAPLLPLRILKDRNRAGAYVVGLLVGAGLLTDDVFMSMRPLPLEYQGRGLVAHFCALLFGAGRRFDLVPTRANGQPAFGTYLRAPTGIRHGTGLFVLTLTGQPDLRHDPLRKQTAPIVRATAIAPEPIASVPPGQPLARFGIPWFLR